MVVIEVVADDARCVRDLSAGGLFVPGCTLRLEEECDLVVRAPGGELVLHARAVFVDPGGGTGLELVGFDAEMKLRIAQLLTAPPAPATAPIPAPIPAVELETSNGSEEEELLPPGETLAASADAGEAPGAEDDEADARPQREPLAKNVYERLRGLTLAEQVKAAHSPDPTARMALERIYGKNVWEPLLRNPRLTAPEVARIARMGQLPKPLIEIILANGAWLQIGEVRRALLTNPRLATDQVLRILRLLPKHELKLASITTAYPYAVRDAAKRLMRDA
jgi:hypothetical protein